MFPSAQEHSLGYCEPSQTTMSEKEMRHIQWEEQRTSEHRQEVVVKREREEMTRPPPRPAKLRRGQYSFP